MDQTFYRVDTNQPPAIPEVVVEDQDGLTMSDIHPDKNSFMTFGNQN